ncbi:hypothetical protein GCM10010361_34770 [Streptomyces olivaceiscleroticus]|uniref:Secreted protein n=1 Tax=Streptomyces olivaceiscleroticus TaxID=68245 RepID=A0ABN1A4Y3_9ACTN
MEGGLALLALAVHDVVQEAADLLVLLLEQLHDVLLLLGHVVRAPLVSSCGTADEYPGRHRPRRPEPAAPRAGGGAGTGFTALRYT